MQFEAVQGDMTSIQADALVNAANNHFWMGGGVAGALKRAGGGNIETEAMSQGPVAVGEAVVTRGGNLDTSYVIHAAVMGPDLVTDADAIARATRSSLERARELQIESIAFPAFGTGVGGFPPADAARAMIDSAVRFLENTEPMKLKRLVFVLFSSDLKDAFDDAIADRQRSIGH